MRKAVSEAEIDAMLARMRGKDVLPKADIVELCPPPKVDRDVCVNCQRLQIRIEELEARLQPKHRVKDAAYWREQKRKQRARKRGGQ